MDDDLDDYKLDTTFELDHTSHISYKSDRGRDYRRLKVEQRWYTKAELGAGSFGTVRLQTTNDGQQRAVKAVKKTLAKRHGIDHRRELAALTTFSRAKFAQYEVFVDFFGWFEDPEFLYLAMEYLPLGDLSNFSDQGLPESDIKGICLQLLEGLEIMHNKGFAHRDLKPQNIFVVQTAPSWWIKIGDFGITKRVRSDNMTQLRTTTGTQGYEAPEIRGYVGDSWDDEESDDGTHVYTNSVDIWSLGCIVYELVTHQLPFPTIRVLKRFCDGQTPFPNDLLGAEINPISAEFIQSLLAKEPSMRPTATSALENVWFTEDSLSRHVRLSQRDSVDFEKYPERSTINRNLVRTELAGSLEAPFSQAALRPSLDILSKEHHVYQSDQDLPGTATILHPVVREPTMAKNAVTWSDQDLGVRGVSSIFTPTSQYSEPFSYEDPLFAPASYHESKEFNEFRKSGKARSIIGHHLRKSLPLATSAGQNRGFTSFHKPLNRSLKSWLKKSKKSTDLESRYQEVKPIYRVFGNSLQECVAFTGTAICLRNSEGRSYVYGKIPLVVAEPSAYLKECLKKEHLKSSKYTEHPAGKRFGPFRSTTEPERFRFEAIFDTAGDPVRVQNLIAMFDSSPTYGEGMDWNEYTAYDAASLILQWLVSLPEPLVPLDLYESFRKPRLLEYFGPDNDATIEEQKLEAFREVFKQLPPLNRCLLLYFLDLWASVLKFAPKPFGSFSRIIADTFRPSVLCHPNQDVASSQENRDIIAFLIENQAHFVLDMEGVAETHIGLAY